MAIIESTRRRESYVVVRERGQTKRWDGDSKGFLVCKHKHWRTRERNRDQNVGKRRETRRPKQRNVEWNNDNDNNNKDEDDGDDGDNNTKTKNTCCFSSRLLCTSVFALCLRELDFSRFLLAVFIAYIKENWAIFCVCSATTHGTRRRRNGNVVRPTHTHTHCLCLSVFFFFFRFLSFCFNAILDRILHSVRKVALVMELSSALPNGLECTAQLGQNRVSLSPIAIATIAYHISCPASGQSFADRQGVSAILKLKPLFRCYR